MPHDELKFNTTPNIITLVRMAFVPVVVGLLFLKDPKWDLLAAILFGVASITDYIDGYIARTQQIVTIYGKLMDPLADKFLVVSSLIMLQEMGRIHPTIVIVLVCRELAITGLRALASAEGVIIEASDSAKWKTATQMVAIPFMMVHDGLLGLPFFTVGKVLLYVSLGISLWSAKDYVVGFFKGIQKKRKERAAQRIKRQETQLSRKNLRFRALKRD